MGVTMGTIKSQAIHLAESLMKIDRVRVEHRLRAFPAYFQDASRILEARWTGSTVSCASCGGPTLTVIYQGVDVCKFCGEGV